MLFHYIWYPLTLQIVVTGTTTARINVEDETAKFIASMCKQWNLEDPGTHDVVLLRTENDSF